jgi:hypothetical protein
MNPDEEAVRAHAYRLWEQRGKHEGRAEHDWLEAEQLLRQQDANVRREGATNEPAEHSMVSTEADTQSLVDTTLDMGSQRSRKNRSRDRSANRGASKTDSGS